MESNYNKAESAEEDKALRICEAQDDNLHNRLSVILNELSEKYGVDMDTITEIEDLYIKKGIAFCATAYKIGRNKGRSN